MNTNHKTQKADLSASSLLQSPAFWLRMVFLGLAIAIMVLIFLFSSQNAVESNHSSSGFSLLLMKMLSFLDSHTATLIVRKGAHFSIYAALGFFFMGAFLPAGSARKKSEQFQYSSLVSRGSFALALCFLYACSDEWHQTFVPGRSGEFRDVLLDSTGSLCGILIMALLFWGFFILKRGKAKAKNMKKPTGTA